ncbi:uncharacterized protein LOC107610458 [Arachis ipaensis]|uniref:uncharacterized protein LOC107610458 n=1 Tax=Arachis ipaensis TaxID=130454 RepID=UPI0007AFAAB6|nr:uncharacterized protein LOC107610458 [Arachis ipaensis]
MSPTPSLRSIAKDGEATGWTAGSYTGTDEEATAGLELEPAAAASLVKAYDRVRWNFVDIVLQQMGFGLRWRTWVKECVTTASMSVLINRMVGEAVSNGRISPLLVGGDNIELSHLQFVDDTILFCPQETETILTVSRRLTQRGSQQWAHFSTETETIVNYVNYKSFFDLMSGLSINFDKSTLISVNCEQEWVTDMCGLLGCTQATLPVRYLGISLGANPQLVKTWKPIIDKVEDKLSL